jgi:hypothetical protein
MILKCNGTRPCNSPYQDALYGGKRVFNQGAGQGAIKNYHCTVCGESQTKGSIQSKKRAAKAA